MFGKAETIEPSAFSNTRVIRTPYSMVEYKIRAGIFAYCSYFFVAPSETRKNISQFAKYPRVLCVELSNIVYVSMMDRAHTFNI